MKKYQIFILIVICFLLTGCGWEDVQKDYGDLLKKNPSCIYNSDSSYGNLPGIKTLSFSADYDGFYVGYDEATRQKAFGTDGASNVISLKDVTVTIDESFAQSFLQEYVNTGNRCPQKVYLSRAYPYGFQMEYDDEHGYLDIFSLNHSVIEKPTSTSDGKTEISKKMCHHSYATDCIKFKKGDYNYELGYYSKADSSIGKYFMVADSDNYSSGDQKEIKDNEEVMAYYNLSYFVITVEAINEIWYGNGKILPKDSITIREDPMQTSKMYYITGPNATNYGWEDRDQGVGEDAPDIDPDYKEQYDVELRYLEVTPINICSKESGTLKAFQIIGYLIFIMKIVVPLILIIMVTLDFTKAVISSGEKPNLDVLKKVATRVAIAIAIFMVPTVLDFLLGLVDGTEGVSEGFEACTACLLDPLGKCQDQFNE